MASEKNKSERQLFSTLLQFLIGNTEISRQVTSYREIYEVGSLLLIHGKTTTLPANRTTKGPRHGSFKGTHSRNGKYRDQIHFCGSTGSVSGRMALSVLQRLMALPFSSGCRQECSLVREKFDILVLRTYGVD
jgi:hypothetical protein